MSVTIYHNPRCSKSREALALIEKKGLRPHVIEYLKTPPSAAELGRLLQLLKLNARDIVRAKDAAQAGIAVAKLKDKALIQALAAHPIAIERPIVVAGRKAVVARPPEKVLDIL